MSRILDGKLLAKSVRRVISEEVTQMREHGGRPPGLGVVLVGSDPASKAYVASKEKLAGGCGLYTVQRNLPEACTQSQVQSEIEHLNEDPAIDGILLQLPLPKHLDASSLIKAIRPDKDADGLHAFNQGFLVRGEYETFATPVPCTPKGCLLLIDAAIGQVSEEILPPPVDLSGKKAVVIGRSTLVGKPIALLLLDRNATVTIAHSRTVDIEAITREADIVVAAVGRPHFITASWIKKGAVVIDVGINRLPSGELVGDVDFASVSPLCAAITPVPGGVGPMTVSQLIANTFQLYKQR
jgi:methylenetetrahydrofolate dehydrogenase (NADP+) / methenyltetrahydrofolate cyclohydrolase